MSTTTDAVTTDQQEVPLFGSPRVTVVIPTTNEAKNLPHVLPRIPGWVYEVILVDANSSDGTPGVARAL